MNTCKTCKHWNFKLGGLPDGSEWGDCNNPRVIATTRVSCRLVDLGDYIKEDASYAEMMNQISDYARIQVEESSFGCIHHEEDDRSEM